MSVLLIDDEADLVLLWCEYLNAKGIPARSAHRVDEVDAALDQGPVEVVVIDYQLPDGTAADVLDRLDARGSGARAVLCSGHGGHLPHGVLDRAHSVVGKPLRLEQLVRAIEAARDAT